MAGIILVSEMASSLSLEAVPWRKGINVTFGVKFVNQLTLN